MLVHEPVQPRQPLGAGRVEAGLDDHAVALRHLLLLALLLGEALLLGLPMALLLGLLLAVGPRLA